MFKKIHTQERMDLLCEAVAYDQLGKVKQLIKEGVNVNEAHQNGGTPLMFASGTGNYDMVKYLIDNGAIVNLTDKLVTPLEVAEDRLIEIQNDPNYTPQELDNLVIKYEKVIKLLKIFSEKEFNDKILLSSEKYANCIGIVLKDLHTVKVGNQLEMMIFAQYLSIRLAFQNGIKSENLIDLMRIEDDKMDTESDLPNYEIQSFRSKRFERFSEYECDWNIFKSDDWGNTSPFSFARHKIYGKDSLSFDIVFPFMTAIVSAIKQLQIVVGELKNIDDEWNHELLPLLEQLSK